MKRIFLLVLPLVLLMSICSYAGDIVRVTVNGDSLDFDVPPIIHEGRTLVPLRGIFEALGASLEWDGDTKTVTAVKDDTTIILQIGNKNATVNGQPVTLDVPAQLVSGRTMVPVRFISESMGAYVGWNQGEFTVVVRTSTILDGKLQKSVTYNAKGNPYLIKGNFTAKSDVVVNFEEGCEIHIYNPETSFYSSLNLNGTNANPIVIIDETADKNAVINIQGKNNVIKYVKTDVGVELVTASKSSVENVDFINTPRGILLENSSGSTIKDCTFSRMEKGITVLKSDNTTIQKNTFNDVVWGMGLQNSERMTISENTITGSEKGVTMSSCANSEFISNTLQNTTDIGLLLDKSSYGNTFYYNNFMNNAVHVKASISGRELNMKDNYWGTVKVEDIMDRIIDRDDNVDYPRINIDPIANEAY